MEINCPDCSQRLRVPDHLTNPLVRCRNCGKTFRPAETAESRIPFAISVREPLTQPEPATEPRPAGEKSSDAHLHDFLSQPRAEPSVAEQAKNRKKSIGWGAGVLIALLLLKGGPKLVKHLLREDRKPQNAPARFDPKLQPEIQKLLEPQRRQPRPPPRIPQAPLPEAPSADH